MCRIDGAERVNIFQSADRKARKEHRCDECRRTILPGEVYHYEFGELEGDPETYRTCQHCLVAREWLLKNCEGWIYTQVMEEIWEHVEEYPKLGLPLMRIYVGARRKWKSFKGGLMALPKMPPAITIHS
jgi:hypothetical protein